MDHFSLKRPHFFFTTAPMPCPYIPGRLERKIVTELIGSDAEDLHESLSRAGFRRSHSIAYTPACPGCTSCIPVRVIVDDFKADKTMRRVTKINQGLTVRRLPAKALAEHYRLFSRYQDSRHNGGDMALMGFYDYRSMIEDSPIDTYLLEFRSSDNTLVAVCLIDQLCDGLSAVYSFYDTTDAKKSLGTYIVLWLIGEAIRLELPYVYLGYWISDSTKMAYKTRFQPLEAFGPGGWHPLDLEHEES